MADEPSVDAPAPAPGTKGLGRRTVSGISWTLFGNVLSNVLRIAVVAILGRLMSPEDFSVVAAAMIVIFFAARVRDAGLGLALVQKKEITRAHVEASFAFSLLFGLALAGGVFLAAEPVAALLGQPGASDPIRALSVMFVIRGIASTSQFMCQRDLQFRALALVDLIAYVVGSAVSVAMAFAGYGAWSLVVGYMVETLVDSSLLLYVRPPARPRLQWKPLRELLGLGGGQTLAHLANYFATQGDYMVVGHYLDKAALGVYTRAYELMRFPATVFASVAGSVLFSSFAKLQDEPERLGQAFRRVLFANAIVLLPASAGLVVLAPEAVRILMGPGWDRMVIPFQILATSMLWRTDHKAAVIVARSVGDVFSVAAWNVAYAIGVIGGAMISYRWGITGVAVTTAITVFLHFLNMCRLALKNVDYGWGVVARAHVDGCVLAVLAVAGALPIAWILRAADLHAAPIAIAGTLAGIVLPAAYAYVQVRRRSPDWVWLVDRVKQLGGKQKKTGRGLKNKPPGTSSPTG